MGYRGSSESFPELSGVSPVAVATGVRRRYLFLSPSGRVCLEENGRVTPLHLTFDSKTGCVQIGCTDVHFTVVAKIRDLIGMGNYDSEQT